jgi:sialate O-acetylesterase
MLKLPSVLKIALPAIIAITAFSPEFFGQTEKPLIHPLFSDNAVLQRDREVPVWGWTTPGADVSVSIAGRTLKGKAGSDGKWMVRLPAHAAGGPYTMSVSGPESVTLKNVLYGDVWLASGQSNMEMGIAQVMNAKEEIANSSNPMLRLFTVPKEIDSKVRDTVKGNWSVSSPETVSADGWGGFSAVAYFFGTKLQSELGIPIGLIHSSWGGTVGEGWVSKGSLSEIPEFRDKIASLDADIAALNTGPVDVDKEMIKWWREYDSSSPAPVGWRTVEFDDYGWKTTKLPGVWENGGLPDFDGVAFFRKSFDLPEAWKGKDLLVSLGPVDDNDATYFNGVQIGATNKWDTPREYTISAKLVKTGKNSIAVEVLDTGGAGGFYGEPEQMFVRPADGSGDPIPLAGEWRFLGGDAMQDLKTPPSPSGNFTLVNARYNAMIHPLFPYAIKGAIWYQGESNVGRAEQYEKVMALLIRDWRAGFRSGDFPFLIVSLANYMERRDEPTESGWARLREAQAHIARDDSNSGLAVTIDLGEADDIHPKNKQDVGLRLALIALAKTYGKDVEYSGPVFRSMKVEGSSVVLSFDHAEGLTAKDGPLTGFEVAGADKKFHWADAKIEGGKVVLSSPDVGKPVAVRYAWQDNPNAPLYNSAGLPAVPFRTDDW